MPRLKALTAARGIQSAVLGCVVVPLLSLAACGQGTTAASAGATSAPSCGSSEVAGVVTGFIAAFNEGNKRRLDDIFATSGFAWYSTDAPGARFDPEARDRGSLASYFADRHLHHERLMLKSFQFNGVSAGNGNFEYKLSRAADSLSATPYGGKGAVSCETRPPKLILWSMAKG